MPVLVYTYVMDILYIVLFCLEHGIAPMNGMDTVS